MQHQYTDALALRDASSLFDDIFDKDMLAAMLCYGIVEQVEGFRAATEAEIASRLQSDVIPRAVSRETSAQDAEIERLTALVQLGLKIIEQGDSRCESDAAELKRFLNEASQL